jgi:hypothetical protein
MREDVDSEVPAPRGKCSEKEAHHADREHIIPSFVSVAEAKEHSLYSNGDTEIAAERVQLAL